MTVARYMHSLGFQLRAAEGFAGAIRVFQVLLLKRLRRAPRKPADAIGVPMKALAGAKLLVRPGTSDLRNASYYYASSLFLPPPEIADRPLRQIAELGSNMGAALTALAVRYPEARLLGVEPDEGNAALASRNVERFGERCRIVRSGIWDEDTELIVDRDTAYGEHGFTVRPREGGDPPGETRIQALKIDTVLERYMPDAEIDYMHISIEGTEPRVFRAGGAWPRRVMSLRVEAHPEFGYPAEDCVADLRALGYEAWPDAVLPDKWVYGIRR
jgi:FkbM family methyltransferase